MKSPLLPLIPNARLRRTDQGYIRVLVKATGLSQGGCADRIGVSPRILRQYLTESDSHVAIPYPVQFTLEALVIGIAGKLPTVRKPK